MPDRYVNLEATVEDNFSEQEAQEILRLAAEKFAAAESERRSQIRSPDLVQMASEIGVPEEYVAEAIATTRAERKKGPPIQMDLKTPVPGNPGRDQWVRHVPGYVSEIVWVQMVDYLCTRFKGLSQNAYRIDIAEWIQNADGAVTFVGAQNHNGFVRLQLTRPKDRSLGIGKFAAVLLLAFAPALFYTRYVDQNLAGAHMFFCLIIGFYAHKQLLLSKEQSIESEAVMDHLECLIRRSTEQAA